MFIAKLTAYEIDWMKSAIKKAHKNSETFRIAFDPLDNSIKWKLGNGLWSPPIKTEEL